MDLMWSFEIFFYWTCLTWCFFGGVNLLHSAFVGGLMIVVSPYSLVCLYFLKFITTSTSSYLPASHYLSTSRLKGESESHNLMWRPKRLRRRGKKIPFLLCFYTQGVNGDIVCIFFKLASNHIIIINVSVEYKYVVSRFVVALSPRLFFKP